MRVGPIIAFVLVILSSLVAGEVAVAQALKKIAIGEVAPIATSWPAYVATEKGFFKQEGVDPQPTYVGNVAAAVQQMVGGSFDIAVSSFDTGLRAIGAGADAVLIAGYVTKYPYSIMVAKNVDTVADLKGKRIVLPFQKDLLTVTWNKWVREQGMQPSDIDQVYDGATPNRFAALAGGTVQAALVGPPFDFRARDQGFKKLLDIGAYAKEYGFLTLISRPKWLKENPETARAYLRALSIAVDWLYDPANRDEAIAILAKATKLDQSSATNTYEYFVNDLKPFSRKLALPEQIVNATVKTLVELGDIKQPTKPLTDTSYLPN